MEVMCDQKKVLKPSTVYDGANQRPDDPIYGCVGG